MGSVSTQEHYVASIYRTISFRFQHLSFLIFKEFEFLKDVV